MIRIVRHRKTKYLEVRAPFEYKDTIKALADYPDVKWDAEGKAWLVDGLLFDKLASYLGHLFDPLDLDTVMWLPTPATGVAQTPRRRTKRQVMADKATDKEAARAYGKTIVEYGRAQRERR